MRRQPSIDDPGDPTMSDDVREADPESFFARALMAAPSTRAAFLRRARDQDTDFLERVERMLKAPDDRETSLDSTCTGLDPSGAVTGPPDSDFPGPRGASGPEAPPEGPGALIGPYQLLAKLGEGGMGVVFLAEQDQPVRRTVALKIMKPGMETDAVIARFQAERQALALMDHTNIARVLDAGTTPAGRPFFVMELVQGVTIGGYCDSNDLTTRQRLELFLPVCRAIQHAHQKGIIHRDIKPSNVLVAVIDGAAVPKVIDFGVAKAIDQRLTDETYFTRYGQVVGTPEYMSPEQAGIEGSDIDTRSDIYSLGVLLYELLTGSTPFQRAGEPRPHYTEILRRIREDEPPRPSLRLGESQDSLATISARRKTEPARLMKLVRGELDWIVMKALEKDRGRRYETAAGLARDVERYLDDEPVEAGPPSMSYRLSKFARKHRHALAAAALTALVLAAATAVSAWLAIRATRAERRAQSDRDRAFAAEADALRQRDAAVNQRARADEQAAVARAVNAFLRDDLLGQVDVARQASAERTPDPEVKVRTLLDRAAGAITARFADQPVVEAAIRQTLGDAYFALGRYPEAQSHLDRTLELRRRRLGDEDAETLSTLADLAALDRARGRYEQAEMLFRRVYENRRRVLGPDHPDTLRSLSNLALSYESQGRYEEAMPFIRQALEARRRVLGPDHPDTLVSQCDLAWSYRMQRKYADAEPLYVRTLEARRRVLGLEHPDTLFTEDSLGRLYQAQGRSAEAEPLFRSSYEARLRILPPDHPDTLTSQQNLASLYQAAARYEDAEPLFRRTFEARRRMLGPGHAKTIASQNSLAMVCRDRGRYAEAEQLLGQILEFRRRELGPDNPETVYFEDGLASVYQAQGRYDRAEPLIRRALEVWGRSFGPEHPHTLIARQNLALLYQAAGRCEDADPILVDLLAIRRRTLKPDDPRLADSLEALGANELKRHREAPAEPLLRECLAIRDKKQAEDWRRYRALGLLGGCLFGLGRYPEAEPLLLRAFEAIKAHEPRIPAPSRSILVEAGARIIALYDAWGKKAKADEWRAKLGAAATPGKPAGC
jgi:serine/threonine protein kinase